jgi:hypothetical protein
LEATEIHMETNIQENLFVWPKGDPHLVFVVPESSLSFIFLASSHSSFSLALSVFVKSQGRTIY